MRTPAQTRTPARAPIRTADVAFTNAQGAVMATSPASMPLHAIEMSGLPNLKAQKIMAASAPAQAARLVFTATTEMRRSVAARVEPGLNPIQPNSRMNVRVATKVTVVAGQARGVPSGPYLAVRGPRTIASAVAHQPPMPWTTVEPAKSQ